MTKKVNYNEIWRQTSQITDYYLRGVLSTLFYSRSKFNLRLMNCMLKK